MSEKPPILLVDDEPDILHSLVGLLRREFDVHIAESAAEALKIISEKTIHVVMTDQRMPEMTGADLTREVNRQHPEVSRILFTGYADIKSVIDAINHGGLFRYVTKPWDPDDLLELLRDAAAEYRKANAERQLVCETKNLIDLSREAISQMESSDLFTAEHSETVNSLKQSCDRMGELLSETHLPDEGA